MNLTTKPQLCKKILMIDGYSATGKGLLSHFFETFNETSKVYVDHIFSEIAYMTHFEKIDKEYAKYFLDMKIDIQFENDYLSREVNFRPFDDSSIFKSSKHLNYISNLFHKDGDDILKKNIENRNLLIMNHFTTPFYYLYDNFFGKRLKYVEIVKHPAFVIDHWFYLFQSLRNINPRMNNFLNKINNNYYFWFEGEDINPQYNIEERVISSLLYLNDLNNLKNKDNNLYLKIVFEDFISNTSNYIQKIEKTFNLKSTKKTNKFIKKFDLDTNNFVERKWVKKKFGWKSSNVAFDENNYKSKLRMIEKKINNNLFTKFLDLCNEYEKQNNLYYLNTKNIYD